MSRLPIPEFIDVASTQILAIGYTPETRQLFIVFKPKGSVYRYFGFPEHEFDAFKGAKSIGTFFGERVKGKDKAKPLYKFERIATGKEEFTHWFNGRDDLLDRGCQCATTNPPCKFCETFREEEIALKQPAQIDTARCAYDRTKAVRELSAVMPDARAE